MMDEDAIYAAIGRFIVAIQAVESKLREMIWLCTDPEFSSSSRKPMAGESFNQTTERALATIPPFINRHGSAHAQAVLDDLQSALDGCRSLNQRRNRVVHSAYIHHEVADELHGITRAYMKRGRDGNMEFEYEGLDEETFDSAMTELGRVLSALGQIHLQLIHWYGRQDAPPGSE